MHLDWTWALIFQQSRRVGVRGMCFKLCFRTCVPQIKPLLLGVGMLGSPAILCQADTFGAVFKKESYSKIKQLLFTIRFYSGNDFIKNGRKPQIIEIALSICPLCLCPTFWEAFYWPKIWAQGLRAQKQFMKLTPGYIFKVTQDYFLYMWSPLVRRHLSEHLLWSIFQSSVTHITHYDGIQIQINNSFLFRINNYLPCRDLNPGPAGTKQIAYQCAAVLWCDPGPTMG